MDQQGEENNEQYKEKLFHMFSDTGMLNSVKAQLRHKLVEKLVKSQKSQQIQQKFIDEKNQHKQLLFRLMASIVSEYLQKHDFQYSNSIFLPESTFADKILERYEILDIMNSKNIDNPAISILESMVATFLNNVKNVPKTNCSTQTEHADAIFNLEQRLNTVDHKFREKIQEINTPAHEIEERLQRFKRDYDARMKGEMNAEIVRIREFEISTIRMEEQEKNRKQMSEYREELEKNFMDRLNKLRDRERDTLEKCTSKMKEIETINHDHRQRILKDFELLRMREDEIDKQRILNEETIKVQKQKLENLEQELKEKIKKADESQLIIEKKYQNDLAYTKLEAHRDLESEKLEILEKKRALDEDMYKIKSMKDTVTQFTDQNRKLAEDNRKLTDELIEIKRLKNQQELELVQLRDNLRTVSDSYKRDQDSSKHIEQKLKVKDEEVNFYKTALEEQKKLVDSYKQSSVDNLKKFNNEIQVYQDKIEQLDDKIKELRKINKENEEQLDQARQQRYELHHKQPFEVHYSHHHNYSLQPQSQQQQQYYNKPSFSKELDELKEKRRQEMLQYQRETEVLEKKNYTIKFDNIWDISNTSIDFSQFKQKQIREQTNFDNKYHNQQDKDYKNNLLDKAELTRSQLYQDLGIDKKQMGYNLIEESFREESNNYYDQQRLRDSRESEKIDQNNNSRLRVMSEVEKSRRDSFNITTTTNKPKDNDFQIKKTSGNTTSTSPIKNKELQQQQQQSNNYIYEQQNSEKIQTKSTFSRQNITNNQIGGGSLQDNPSIESQMKQQQQQQNQNKREESQSVIAKDSMLSIPASFTQMNSNNRGSSPLEMKKGLQPLNEVTKKETSSSKSGGLTSLPIPIKQQKQQSDWNYSDDFDDDLDDFSGKNKKQSSSSPYDKKDNFTLPKTLGSIGGGGQKKDMSNPFSSSTSIKNNEFSLPSTSKQNKNDNNNNKQSSSLSTSAWPPLKQDKSTIDDKKQDEDNAIFEEIEEVVDYDDDEPIDDDDDILPL